MTKTYDHFDFAKVPHETLWFIGYGHPDERICVLVGVQEDSLAASGEVRYYVMADAIRHGERLEVLILGYHLFPTRRAALERLAMNARRDIEALQGIIANIEAALAEQEQE